MGKYHSFTVYVDDELGGDVDEAYDKLNAVEGVIEIEYEDTYED